MSPGYFGKLNKGGVMGILRLAALLVGLILIIATILVGARSYSPIWIVYMAFGFTAVMVVAHPVGPKILLAFSKSTYHGTLMVLVVAFQQLLGAAVCFYIGVGLTFVRNLFH